MHSNQNRSSIATIGNSRLASKSAANNDLLTMPARVLEYFREGRFRDALQYANRFEPFTDRPFELAATLGHCYRKVDEPELAIRRYCSALEHQHCEEVASSLGAALQKMSTRHRGEVDVGQVTTSLLSGLRHLANAEYSQARKMFDHALRLWPYLDVAAKWGQRAVVRERLEGRFCARPFEQIHVNNGGVTTVCCGGWLPASTGNVLNDATDDIWNGRAATLIRQSIHSGDYRYCNSHRCPHIIAGDLKLKTSQTEARQREIIDTRIVRMVAPPRRVALNYDKSCNLSCPSCRSNVVQLHGKPEAIAAAVQEKVLSEWLKGATHLKTNNAGDVFGSNISRRMLAQLNANRFPNLKLELITNGIALTRAAWHRYQAIRPMIESLEISVDAATADTFAMVRRGGDMDTLMKNFDVIREVREAGYIPRWHLSFVVQAKNFHEMGDFVRLGLRYGVDQVIFKKVTPRNGQKAGSSSFVEQFEIHNPHNRRSREFYANLADPIFDDPIVRWSNLADARPV